MTEIFTILYTTSLASSLSTTSRPTTISVNATQSAFGGGSYSIAIYDAGTDANPQHFEALEVISGGGTTTWTVQTESGYTPLTHASGSTIIATVLTPRALQQPMLEHTTPGTIADPHTVYLLKSNFQTKGDLLVGSGNTTFIRLIKGFDGQVLTADSSQTGGMRWASVGIAQVLQHMGDLNIGGLLGVDTRLPIGSVGQSLLAEYNTPVTANPLSGPTCVATGSGGALSNGQAYDFAFAWQSANASPDGGITQVSPITTFTATGTGQVQVQCGSAPSTGLTLVVYANITGQALQQQGILSNASISISNNITVTSIAGGVNPSLVNTTGGISPAWVSSGTVTSVSLSAPAAEFVVTGSPVTGSGTLGLNKANQLPHIVFAGPTDGVSAPPTFRPLAINDLPLAWHHEEFNVNSSNTITLSIMPVNVLIVAKNGTVLQMVPTLANASLSASVGMNSLGYISSPPGTLPHPTAVVTTSASAGMQAIGVSSAIGMAYNVMNTTLTFTNNFIGGDHVTVSYTG